MMNFQMQLTRRNDTLPMTRGYMDKCEKALVLRDMKHQPEMEEQPAAPAAEQKRRRKVAE
jgi:cyclopropane-fatty-acyl-phospholipid synthase